MRSPLPTRCALKIPSVMIEEIDFIETWHWLLYSVKTRQLLSLNFSSSIDMALDADGILV